MVMAVAAFLYEGMSMHWYFLIEGTILFAFLWVVSMLFWDTRRRQ